MKHSSETLAASRVWAAGLCDAVEQSAGLFQFWDEAVQKAHPMNPIRRRVNFGCGLEKLIEKRETYRRAFLDKPLGEPYSPPPEAPM